MAKKENDIATVLRSRPKTKSLWASESAIWGHGSLVARVTPSGQRMFYFRYQNSAGNRDSLLIGSYSAKPAEGYLTLTEARSKAYELAALHQSGILNIRQHIENQERQRKAQHEAKLVELERQTQAFRERMTVTQLFEYWMEVDLIRRKDKGAEIRRLFEKDVLPIIGSLAAEDVRKRHVTEVTDKLLSRGVKRQAKVAFSSIRQMFRFAVVREIVEIDPTASISKTRIGGQNIERERFLTDEEVQQLVKQLPDANLVPTTEAAIWICLSTCCRISELLNAEWKDIDLSSKKWRIPASNSKNGRPHTVYLSEFSIRQFRKLWDINGHSPWCCPNRRNDGPIDPKTITKQITDRQVSPNQKPIKSRSRRIHALILPGGKWTPHDLRRTGSTIMGNIGVSGEVVDRCLNHIEQNRMKRTYQRYNYAREMEQAWLALGNHLDMLVDLSAPAPVNNVIKVDFGEKRNG